MSVKSTTYSRVANSTCMPHHKNVYDVDRKDKNYVMNVIQMLSLDIMAFYVNKFQPMTGV